MAKQPRNVEIRSYQVGFGDCFLLTFVYESERKHVLIDFGTTGLPKRLKSTVGAHMKKVAERIREVVGDEGLTAVVATHRHADHISGFGTDSRTGGSGNIIKALKPKLVLQPWTEHPRAPRNGLSAPAAKNQKQFITTLDNMNAIADQARQLAALKPNWMSASAIKELSFLGEDNIKNKSAVANLMAMGAGKKGEYLRYGEKSRLATLLPGVKVHVLGPPDLTQSDAIRVQKSKDQDEFWHMVKGVVPNRAEVVKHSTGSKRVAVPAEARWFRNRLQGMTERGILEIVRQLDAQMNNTSLILLFEYGSGAKNRKLLFPGDAQLENWSHVLQGATDSAEKRELLAEVDFYKVGHHGSLNATPKKSLWQNFRKRQGRQLLTMMSTLGGKHGKTANKTEVPRKTLVTALENGSRLSSTQDIEPSALEQVVTI